MKKGLHFLLLATVILLSGCASKGPYVEKESDRLTDQEKYHLFDYSRHFIIRTVIKRAEEKELAEKESK